MGPAIENQHQKTVMFCNGANARAHWRIGWVELDEHGTITDRSEDPKITPPAPKPGEVDIAFAASTILAKDEIWLYYSTEDDKPFRAILTVAEDDHNNGLNL